MTDAPQRLAVVGAGWAGLAAAVRSVESGHAVTLFEMAPQAGGRARQVEAEDGIWDNGQHILIGAYRETLALMRTVGIEPEDVLMRQPLHLTFPDGTGLRMPSGAPVPAFARAVLGWKGWTWRERTALLATAAAWRWRGFQCEPGWTVGRLTAHLPARVRDELIDPLCVAALNTPAPQASAGVFLRVLRDALFSGPGSADLLLPRQRLSALLPKPALEWLAARGASLRLTHRVGRIDPIGPARGGRWSVDDEAFDGVVLACSAVETARLVLPHDRGWADMASGLRYEPIVTVYAHSPGTRLAAPMQALRAGASESAAPAQYVFDLGQLGSTAGTLAFVISGAAGAVARGLQATESATLAQGAKALAAQLGAPLVARRTLIEKRATFLCTAGLSRPAASIADGLVAAGDYVAGPYPATLEGAVQSGTAAARTITSHRRSSIE